MKNDWTTRLLCTVSGMLLTLAGTYATQYFAFMKDSPSRTDVAAMIKESMDNGPYMKEREMLKKTLEAIERNQERNYTEISRMNGNLADLGVKVGKLEVAVTKAAN